MKQNHFAMKGHLLFLLYLSFALTLFVGCEQEKEDGPRYQTISGFSTDVNLRLEEFFSSTVDINGRKVAVFDCDGTLLGQAPYYLADEALFDYARLNYENKTDEKSVQKMAIVDKLLHGDNVGVEYVKQRIAFLSGMTTDDVLTMGDNMFRTKYAHKFYPEMKQLIANLKVYGFEVWIISASPEILFQRFCNEQLGIPEDRILGVRSRVTDNGILTDELVVPVPQELGKAEVINTFIKAKPLFAAGNSRGDMEMMNQSSRLKMIVNPDDTKIEKEMDNQTVKQYWMADPNTLIVYSNDVRESNLTFTCEQWGVKPNASNPK